MKIEKPMMNLVLKLFRLQNCRKLTPAIPVSESKIEEMKDGDYWISILSCFTYLRTQTRCSIELQILVQE